MTRAAIAIGTACLWASSLGAQNQVQPRPAEGTPSLQQWAAPLPAPGKSAAAFQQAKTEAEAALRALVKIQGEKVVCSIPLLTAKIPDNLEAMPVMSPPANFIDRMPAPKLLAPPCDEERR